MDADKSTIIDYGRIDDGLLDKLDALVEGYKASTQPNVRSMAGVTDLLRGEVERALVFDLWHDVVIERETIVTGDPAGLFTVRTYRPGPYVVLHEPTVEPRAYFRFREVEV